MLNVPSITRSELRVTSEDFLQTLEPKWHISSEKWLNIKYGDVDFSDARFEVFTAVKIQVVVFGL